MDKATLRKEALHKRDSIGTLERSRKNRAIEERFLGLEEFKRAKRIFFYASYGTEVETSGLISESLRQSRKVALPKVFFKERVIRFYWIRDIASLSPGYWGIPEPLPEEEARAEEADLVVVPGVAYDERGYRLGYGGGYYDRFLKGIREGAITLGLAYEEQVVKSLPVDEWDIPVNMVVTDKRVITCHGH